MKAVMLSIRPTWCEKIASGKKTIEVRKTCPKLDTPFRCYIYCTKPTQYFYHGGIGEPLDELYRIPNDAPYDAGKIKFGYSGELMCCHAEYDSSNFLCGKVIGEFVCERIERGDKNAVFNAEAIKNYACLTVDEFLAYIGDNTYFAWHISDLVIYDKPRELVEYGLKRAPQSWAYVEED